MCPWTAEEISPRLRKTRTANIASGFTEILAAPISSERRHIVGVRGVSEESGYAHRTYISELESGGSTETIMGDSWCPSPGSTAKHTEFGDPDDLESDAFPVLQKATSLRARADKSGQVSVVTSWWAENY